MNNRFYSHSFGCRVNQAEKEELDRQLIQKGYYYSADSPDIYIINTCSVTHKADREARQLIYQVKRAHPEAKLVVTGCAATNWIKHKVEIPEVDYLVDNQNKEYVASLIDRNLRPAGMKQVARVTQPEQIDKYARSGRIIIKIQDGCMRFCSFCIVPYLRGLPKSVPMQQIIDSIRAQSPQEAILTAINTEAYGYDSKEKFIDLVDRVLAETTVPRISFGSIHPWSVNDEFLHFYERVQGQGRLVKFFHIPLQSGCNKILTLMKRGYTREEFIDRLGRLEKLEPMAFIGTDVIVGYLEETDADFEDTYRFLESSPISKMHIFRFSQRRSTAAYYMAKRLSEPTPAQKSARAKALADLNKRKYEQFQQKHVGKSFTALILEKREGEYQHALLDNQMPALVKTDSDRASEIVAVTVNDLKKGQLLAHLH